MLDLASHDGRYSFAALKTGAAHVTGVEARGGLVRKAEETFAFYGQDPETYRFVCGDVFDVLATEKFDVDVVLCLGFLYHTFRHTELLYRLHGLGPQHLIVDTVVFRAKRPLLRMVLEEDLKDVRSATQDAYSLDRVLVAWPSMPSLHLLLAAYGFEIESTYDWKTRLADGPPNPGLTEYARGKRVTLRCRHREGVPLPAALDRPAASEEPAASAEREQTTPREPRGPAGGWRKWVNDALVKTTGYELRRAPTTR